MQGLSRGRLLFGSRFRRRGRFRLDHQDTREVPPGLQTYLPLETFSQLPCQYLKAHFLLANPTVQQTPPPRPAFSSWGTFSRGRALAQASLEVSQWVLAKSVAISTTSPFKFRW